MNVLVASTDCEAVHMQADMTNIADYNPTADAIQLRPFEVLVQVTRSRGLSHEHCGGHLIRPSSMFRQLDVHLVW